MIVMMIMMSIRMTLMTMLMMMIMINPTSPEQVWGRQVHVQPLGLLVVRGEPEPGGHGVVMVTMVMMVMVMMVKTINDIITKPLAKDASRDGARPWLARRLWA